MNIKMDLFDLLGLYSKAGVNIASEMSSKVVQGFQSIFVIDDTLKYNYFRDKGIAHAKSRRYRQAMAVLQQLHDIDPADDEVALYLGVSMMKTGQREEGLKLLEKARQSFPDNTRIATILSLAYTQNEDYTKALPLLKKMVDADPEDADLRYRLGEACHKAGNNKLAITSLKKALELNERDVRSANLLGRVYEGEEMSDEAAEMFKRVADIEAGQAD
jgi:tetratricopeptide (TPR) repeat protein